MTNRAQHQDTIQTQCCIVGGGPAGMMLGFLLARSGVEVVVLEKHGDFLCDFRGDTIHPSTLELLYELGLLDEFLRVPHQELHSVQITADGQTVPVADFSYLPTHCKFIAFMPQWDFLNFLADKAKQYPTFHLRMETKATDLIEENGQVTGVRATTPTSKLIIKANLVVGTDGRHSTIREKAGLTVQDFGVPIDVLWMRIPKDPSAGEQSLGYVKPGKFMVLIDRQKISLLTMKIDRLRQWYRPGLLCIGDAAHAMSPAGGVGVNMAIQDAVATANLLAEPLWKGTASTRDSARVQRRRQWPVRVIQAGQIFAHRRLINVAATQPKSFPPFILWLFRHVPVFRRLPAYLIGVGPRPEHIKTKGFRKSYL